MATGCRYRNDGKCRVYSKEDMLDGDFRWSVCDGLDQEAQTRCPVFQRILERALCDAITQRVDGSVGLYRVIKNE